MDNLLFILYVITTLMVVGVLPLLEALGGASSGRGAACLVDGALALVLAATILWRRLRWEPVGGRFVGMHSDGGYNAPTTYYWRWTLGGREYEASDLMPALLCAPVSGGRAHTLWVDPGDPSRLLPPSWRERLAVYLLWAPVVLSVGLGNLGWRWEPGMRLLSLMVSHPLESVLVLGTTAACVELWWSRL